MACVPSEEPPLLGALAFGELMWRTLALGAVSFPVTILAFIIGWVARDIRLGLLAGAVVFTLFFLALVISLFFIKNYSYLDAVLPAVFAVLWSLALAPFSFGLSLFSAPMFICAAALLGGCMAIAKRFALERSWLLFPAVVFLYEMLPVNIPGKFDDMFALTGALAYSLTLFIRKALPLVIKAGIQGLRDSRR